jgi:hypothetical protein
MLAAGMAIITAEPMLPGGLAEAFAQRVVQINSARKTTMISVSIGKTEDVRPMRASSIS